MPVCHLEHLNEHTTWGIWEIEEKEEELLNLHPTHTQDQELLMIKPLLRRKQWIAGRVLLKEIMKDHALPFRGVVKDAHKKAWLEGHDYYISIAHSDNLAMAIFNKRHSTGIDVETVKPRILNIAPKFMHPKEAKAAKDDPEELTIYWCAKEALYKHYGRKMVFFKSELRVYRQPGDTDFFGVIHKDGTWQEVPLQLYRRGDFVIVYAC